MNAVPLNTTTLNTRLLNTTRLNTNGFPMLSKRGGSSADISQAITDSLVCWYDIGKQQCTNESMAANPVLADLSGNGHDIECFNFGWSGMSGIGGFVFADSDYYLYSNKPVTVSNHIITLNKCNYAESLIYNPSKYVDTNTERVVVNRPAFKIKVSGVGENEYVRIAGSLFDGNKWSEQNVIWNIGNGITDIPAINQTYNQAGTESRNLVYQDFIITLRNTDNSESPSESIITIEILPQYPNALVSDGVDDYAYVEGLPILTDYTVIAKRKILADKVSALVSKATDNNSTDGAFIFDAKNGGGYIACNFGANNPLAELYPEDVSYQTKESYNGSPIIKLNYADTDKLSLFTFSALKNLVSQYALYSFLLFDRTLTTAEIEWVKKNMIESGGGC